MNCRSTAAAIALLALAHAAALAQGDFPSRQQVKLYVGFPPGGSTDVLARSLAQEGSKLLGQDVIVINKPGATGSLAVNEVVAAPPDGYTIGITPSSAMTLAFLFQSGIRPDLLERTDGLLVVGRQRIGIAVKADSPIKNFADFVERARAEPGKLAVGIPGSGTLTELITRAALQQAKVEVNIVPFQGDSPIATAILGGHIAAGAFSAGGFTPQLKAGTMRLLVSQEEERADAAPDVPTMLELGYPYKGGAIQHMYGPKGLPAPVRDKLIDVFLKASQTPAFISVAKDNALYDGRTITGDSVNELLFKNRASNAELVDQLGLKKELTR
jgi:tripartite-type tricarboxylate transporter receptor subunit TctC